MTAPTLEQMIAKTLAGSHAIISECQSKAVEKRLLENVSKWNRIIEASKRLQIEKTAAENEFKLKMTRIEKKQAELSEECGHEFTTYHSGDSYGPGYSECHLCGGSQ